MATRKENAEAIKQALDIAINTDRSDPKADLLTQWAELAVTDKEAARLQVLTWQAEDALDVQLPSENVTAEQLQDWLARAETEPDAVKAEIRVLTGDRQSDGDTLTAAQAVATTADTLRVTVSAKVAGYDGTYCDPDQPDEDSRIIGTQPVTVHRTPLIQQGLREGSLTEAG